MARQQQAVLHVPASMPPHRCHSSCTPLTACALPGITGDDGLNAQALQRPFSPCRRSCWRLADRGALCTSPWQSASVCRVRGVSRGRLSSMLLGPILGPDRGLWRSPCVRGLACTLSKEAACLRPSERLCLSACVLVSCGRQWTYDASRNTCSMSRIVYWNELKRLICYLCTKSTPFQPSVMSITAK